MTRSLCSLVVPFVMFLSPAIGQAVLDNEAVVKMVKAGIAESLVIGMIQSQPGKYSLGADELIRLEELGISEKILVAMAARGSSSPSADARGSVKLGLKTPVKLVVDETVSSKTAKPGDTFKLAVAEAVLVDNRIVIARGAPATGRITALKKKSFATHNGSLEVSVDSVRTVDGRTVAVDGRVSIGGEGASFGHLGKEAEIQKGYVINAVVAAETQVAI